MPRKKTENKTEIVEQSFYDLNYNELDKDLSPEQLKEWTAIYASFRSRTPLSGTVIGVENISLSLTNPENGRKQNTEILCLVVMDFRVKVIIPQTEIWYDESDNDLPGFVINNMLGAKVNYVITKVDRIGECAVASRRMALSYERNRFFRDSRRIEPGQIQVCNVLVVGPSRLRVECNGFDLELRFEDLSYSSIPDLRTEYRPGQEIKARLISADKEKNTLEISVKEVNPNPFDGAENRHPVGAIRQAVISGTYAGGVFCNLPDDTICLCLYSPNYFAEELYPGDLVKIIMQRYDYDNKLIFGKIFARG